MENHANREAIQYRLDVYEYAKAAISEAIEADPELIEELAAKAALHAEAKKNGEAEDAE